MKKFGIGLMAQVPTVRHNHNAGVGQLGEYVHRIYANARVHGATKHQARRHNFEKRVWIVFLKLISINSHKSNAIPTSIKYNLKNSFNEFFSLFSLVNFLGVSPLPFVLFYRILHIYQFYFLTTYISIEVSICLSNKVSKINLKSWKS